LTHDIFLSFFCFHLVVVPTFHPLVVSIQLRPPLQTDIESSTLVLVSDED
jgi:hypothetical protein